MVGATVVDAPVEVDVVVVLVGGAVVVGVVVLGTAVVVLVVGACVVLGIGVLVVADTVVLVVAGAGGWAALFRGLVGGRAVTSAETGAPADPALPERVQAVSSASTASATSRRLTLARLRSAHYQNCRRNVAWRPRNVVFPDAHCGCGADTSNMRFVSRLALVTLVSAGAAAVLPIAGGPAAAAATPAIAPLVPGRILETRSGPNDRTVDGLFEGVGAVAGGSQVELQVGGRHGVPADAAAVMLNVTSTGSGEAGFLSV